MEKKMRFVIQVCSKASVTVDKEVVGSIGRGYMVLIGVGQEDTQEIADKMVEKMLKLRINVEKMLKLRINPDENGKTNKSLSDVGGGLLLISQFTLYADCSHGNRPSFVHAGAPDKAKCIYEYIIEKCKASVPVVETGIFGADMHVDLTNEGPFTIVLDSKDIIR